MRLIRALNLILYSFFFHFSSQPLRNVLGSHYNIDDSILYKMSFELSNSLPQLSESTNLHIMKTNHNEVFYCSLPESKVSSDSISETIESQNPFNLLKELFSSNECTYRLEPYWNYELCHGKSLRQFHKDSKVESEESEIEYNLGFYSMEEFERNEGDFENLTKDFPKISPPYLKLDGIKMPYLEVNMTKGTKCDLNGKSRFTRVLYVCYPNGRNEFYSFKETSTCEYEAIILSSLLCLHPDYKAEDSSEETIRCYSQEHKKPQNLIALEEESKRLKSNAYEAHYKRGNAFTDSIVIQIKPAGTEMEIKVEMDVETETSSSSPSLESNMVSSKPPVDTQIVEQFLLGEYCLYGGSGWWKYEFCYGKKVIQFHEEKTKERSQIVLGEFHWNDHLAWLEKYSAKRPKALESRKYVSHLYSQGDICDLTKKPRQTEVKLKCKKSVSPSTVSLYLLEPQICEYVLVIESSIVCDILHLADNNGYIVFKPEVFKSQ